MRVRLNGVKSISDLNVQELCATLVCICADLTEYAPSWTSKVFYGKVVEGRPPPNIWLSKRVT